MPENNFRRPPRADAERNRTQIVRAARKAFSSKGTTASLEAIARAAEVGIGTLYRHFPTRDALVEEVYRTELDELTSAAQALSESSPPVAALRAWLVLFVGYSAMKAGMSEVLGSLANGTSELYADSGERLTRAITLLTDAAVASGEIRLSLDPVDLLRALIGVGANGAGPGWEDRAKQLIDVLIAGMRTHKKPKH